MIEAHNLHKRFDEFDAVCGISLAVPRGAVLALLGPNGAGKTTTIRMLTSILAPTSGWARVAGYDVVTEADQVRRRVGVLTEHHGLYNRMYAEEYLSFFAQLYQLDPRAARARALFLLERFDLTGARKRRLGEYSRGMRQKLALIRVMLHDPDVLVLDEPTSAMDPASVRVVRDAIAEMRTDRRAILLCTHNLHEAEELCDRIAVVSHGRIIAQGTPAALKTQLLGPAVYKLCTAQPLGSAADVLAARLEVIASGPDWLTFRSPDPAGLHPQLVTWLTDLGLALVSLAEQPRSLEDVYLQVVETGQPSPAPSTTVEVDVRKPVREGDREVPA